MYHNCAMLSNLEYFILTLVDSGINTPYDLMAKAGISVGSSLPALRRLEKGESIKASSAGARGAVRFTILPYGKEQLSTELANQLKSHPSDLESMLRLVCLAWFNQYEEEDHFERILMDSAASLRAQRKKATKEAAKLADSAYEHSAGNMFRWLRTHLEAHRLQAQAAVLGNLSRAARSKARKAKGLSDKKSREK